MMTVLELMTKLKDLNPRAYVLVYAHEDFDSANAVIPKSLNEDKDLTLYCNGYTFREFHNDVAGDYVIIGNLPARFR